MPVGAHEGHAIPAGAAAALNRDLPEDADCNERCVSATELATADAVADTFWRYEARIGSTSASLGRANYLWQY